MNKPYAVARGLILGLILILIPACTLYPGIDSTPGADNLPDSSANPYFRPTHLPGAFLPSPTADVPHLIQAARSSAESYTVQPGDTLKSIAGRYGVSLDQLIKSNAIENPDIISVGMVLNIPAATALPAPAAFKIIPDSELVYGPINSYFDLRAWLQQHGGYLNGYQETLDGVLMSGPDILERVSIEYSVNPRLLLTVLDYQSGWLSRSDVSAEAKDYPIVKAPALQGSLYRQLAWAANALNQGYYLWKIQALNGWTLEDGAYVSAPAGINAGSAGVYNLLASLYDYPAWVKAVGTEGIYTRYNDLFGYPFDFSIEPLVPVSLNQPSMQLPFEPGDVWSFTGGPHAGWGAGSAWAAIDFAPPGEGQGCVSSDAWVTAVADGQVVYSNFGVVLLDLDRDGHPQTGWSVLYLHVESRERVAAGTFVKAGDRIGHPSCEGGVSNGTHIHLARRYNGEWISADREPLFNLDGWLSEGSGVEYNGYLRKGEHVIEAWDTQRSENQIHR